MRRVCEQGLTLFFLATNAIFTWVSLQHGFAYYGYGYFAAALLSFLIGAMVTFRELGRIPYHTFITQPPTARAAPEDDQRGRRADAGAR